MPPPLWAPRPSSFPGPSPLETLYVMLCTAPPPQSASETLFLEGALQVLRDPRPEHLAMPEFTTFCETVLQ